MAEYVKIAKTTDVAEGKPFCVVADGKKLALFKVEGKYYAVDNTCTHRNGPLCKGALSGDVVQCPWHGSKFNVKTGEVVGGPAKTPIKHYKVRVAGDDLEITD